ncbi:hypothetical protein C8F04DRAFT_1189504 [Mycena alexandri]|uniref:DUF6532 domain-containing protein n=1 Tax=Mycena alexandri TaxID=1745969 RepID=A0AAD6SH36_9AGAR|nr:hypothetical protein C8F04DRAFT_1195041 [Mycena alexandri]KAJ7027538.1 hypothetical protein C8F04DRAFT_1189504 [Mycena alexandri]
MVGALPHLVAESASEEEAVSSDQHKTDAKSDESDGEAGHDVSPNEEELQAKVPHVMSGKSKAQYRSDGDVEMRENAVLLANFSMPIIGEVKAEIEGRFWESGPESVILENRIGPESKSESVKNRSLETALTSPIGSIEIDKPRIKSKGKGHQQEHRKSTRIVNINSDTGIPAAVTKVSTSFRSRRSSAACWSSGQDLRVPDSDADKDSKKASSCRRKRYGYGLPEQINNTSQPIQKGKSGPAQVSSRHGLTTSRYSMAIDSEADKPIEEVKPTAQKCRFCEICAALGLNPIQRKIPRGVGTSVVFAQNHYVLFTKSWLGLPLQYEPSFMQIEWEMRKSASRKNEAYGGDDMRLREAIAKGLSTIPVDVEAPDSTEEGNPAPKKVRKVSAARQKQVEMEFQGFLHSTRGRDGQEDLDLDQAQHGKAASSHRSSSDHQHGRTGKSGPSGNPKRPTGGRTGSKQGGDVLAQYRANNRATRPPDPRKLAAHAQRQTRVEEDSDNQDDDDADDNDEEEEEATGEKRRKTRTSTGVVTSLQEGFYPPFFRKTFDITKLKLFEDLLNGHLYPDFDRLLPKIIVWLTDAISYCEEELGLIEPEGIWEEYQADMAKLIWNFCSTFRGRCRDIARDVVPVVYKIRPTADDFEGGFGQAEFADKMKDNIEKLLNDHSFLKDGVDDKGRTNNMMHPAISELIFRIVHKSEDCLATALPERFGIYTGELVAAMSLFLKVGIQEYATGRFVKIRFTGENFAKMYKVALRSVAKMKGDRDQHHWEKTRAKWAQWEVEHTIESGKQDTDAEELHRDPGNYVELHKAPGNYAEPWPTTWNYVRGTLSTELQELQELRSATPLKGVAIQLDRIAAASRPESEWHISARIMFPAPGKDIGLTSQTEELKAVLLLSIEFIKLSLLFEDAYPAIVSRAGFARFYLLSAAQTPASAHIKDRLETDLNFAARLADIRIAAQEIPGLFRCAHLPPAEVKTIVTDRLQDHRYIFPIDLTINRLKVELPFHHESIVGVLKKAVFTEALVASSIAPALPLGSGRGFRIAAQEPWSSQKRTLWDMCPPPGTFGHIPRNSSRSRSNLARSPRVSEWPRIPDSALPEPWSADWDAFIVCYNWYEEFQVELEERFGRALTGFIPALFQPDDCRGDTVLCPPGGAGTYYLWGSELRWEVSDPGPMPEMQRFRGVFGSVEHFVRAADWNSLEEVVPCNDLYDLPYD